jgi:uncharacterized protein (DUF58 family)
VGILFKISEAAVEFGGLFGSEFVPEGAKFFPDHFGNHLLLGSWQVFDLFKNFRRTHGDNLLRGFIRASPSFMAENFFILHFAFYVYPHFSMTVTELLETVRRVELRTNRLVNDTMVGAYLSHFKGRGMDFEELREYIPGDDVRDIDWNVTNRLGRPFVKRYREERELTAVLAVDVSGSSAFGSGNLSKREYAAEVAATLALSATRNGDKVALLLFTEQTELFIPPRKGRRHILRIVREMLAFDPKKRGTDIPAALAFLNHALPRRSIVFLLTDFLESNAGGAANPLAAIGAHGVTRPTKRDVIQELGITNARHDLVCLHLHDPRESRLPDAGLLTIEDAETGEILELDSHRGAVRERFASLNEGRLEQLDQSLNRTAVDTLRLNTVEPFAQTLQRFFEIRRGRRRR